MGIDLLNLHLVLYQSSGEKENYLDNFNRIAVQIKEISAKKTM